MNNVGKLKGLFFLLTAVSGGFLFVQERCIAGQSVLKFLPTDDACVDIAEPDRNFGQDSELYIGDRPEGGVSRSYLKFDINPIPEGATIIDAELVLTISGESNCNISAHNVSDCSWGESSITWNNAPEFEPESTVDGFFSAAAHTLLPGL